MSTRSLIAHRANANTDAVSNTSATQLRRKRPVAGKVPRRISHKTMIGRVAKAIRAALSKNTEAYVVAAEAAVAAWQRALAEHLAD